jgi:uncharacterized protein
LIEHCLAVPANRMGRAVHSATELNTNQQIVTLIDFAMLPVVYLGESLKWNRAVGFGRWWRQRPSCFMNAELIWQA